MRSELELDQEDLAARLQADEYLADVKVLLQRKGVTESDVETSLSVINEQAGKIGVCIIVLMPSLRPNDSPDAPGPLYDQRPALQVIEQPLFNLGETGTGKSAEAVAERCRQITHQLSLGRGQIYSFDGMEPTDVAEGKISYTVFLKKSAGDRQVLKSPPVAISSDSASAPANITLTCSTADSILYTVDGSYPSAANELARLYAAPFPVDSCATIRAASLKAGRQQSDIRQFTLS